jgi:tagatose 6-phosphate kinase
MEDGRKVILCVGATPAVQRVMIFKKLEIDQVNRAAETFEGIAGKSINTAKVLKALGRDVKAMGLLGGNRGRMIERELKARGIECEFLEIEPETRQCVTLIDRAGGTHTELVEESRAVPKELYERLFEKVKASLPGAEMLLLCGTLTPGAPVDWYARCVEAGHEAGVPAIVDAQGELLRKSLQAGPMIVKPNRAELAAALGVSIETDGQFIDAMTQLRGQDAFGVLVSMGAKGAMAAHPAGVWRLTVPKVPAINPIGSGDAVTAGLAVGLLRRLSFEESCRLGMACGVANALTILAGEVRTEDVERIVPQVTLEPLLRS